MFVCIFCFVNFPLFENAVLVHLRLFALCANSFLASWPKGNSARKNVTRAHSSIFNALGMSGICG